LKAKQLNNTGCEGKETGEASPLNEVKTVVEELRFDEVDGESPAEVGGEEETEGGAFGVRVVIIAAKGEGEQGKKEDLVELGGMAGDAVAEINSPRKGSRRAECIVGKASEEAAEAPDGNPYAEGDGEEISGAGVNVLKALGNFNGEPAAKKSTDDCLAAGEQEASPT
jgi:hypothetical protein